MNAIYNFLVKRLYIKNKIEENFLVERLYIWIKIDERLPIRKAVYQNKV